MKYLSVCSGIEAATVAWHPLGWNPIAFSEIEKFPASVLQHHYPHVPNLGDMTKYKEWNLGQFDLLVGGTPCQSFSVAGLRKGLADERGNLALVYIHILQRYQPCWFVWENVPGVLSSNGGRDFGTFLGAVAELGYGFAYRVLDAQYVRTHFFRGAVPQRRRRVFVVGYLGDWRRAAAVLFERESLSGNPAPSRKTGKETARSVAFSAGNSGGSRSIAYSEEHTPPLRAGLSGTNQVPTICAPVSPTVTNDPPFSRTGNERVECDALVIARESGQGYWVRDEIAGTIDANMGCSGHSYRPAIIAMAHGQANAEIQTERSPALTCNHEAPIVAFTARDNGRDATLNISPTLRSLANTGGNHQAGSHGVAVCFDARQDPVHAKELSMPLGSKDMGHGVCYPINTMTAIGRENEKNHRQTFGIGDDGDPQFTLQSAHSHAVCFGGDVVRTLSARHDSSPCIDRGMDIVAQKHLVRRLTPVECERLQGFPDNYTNILPKTPDGPRYKALGNSMAVNVMQWIGMRIQAVERLTK